MTNVLIIGATGSIGRVTRQYFLNNSDDQLTLMARHTNSLQKQLNPQRERLITGDVKNPKDLKIALQEQEVVFAALSGDLPKMAHSLVEQMTKSEVQRLLFISSMGIYNEIPATIGTKGNLKNNP
ncbi:NAD-dependent epimerase/dehydratase family protein, partial [Lactobacillus sp. XV13L]|nr:NAD-dependent epimerase/dehydratase family protein [Lactobacillus sp. XV13L]